MKQLFITIVMFFNLSAVFSQSLGKEANSIAQNAINCIENKDYYCGLIQLEQLLKNHSSEMNKVQINSLKVVLIDCYHEVSMAKAQNNDANYKSYCLKGIQLGKEINEAYNLDAFMLHYLMIGHYYHLENELLMNTWIRKFNIIKNNLQVDENPEIKQTMITWSNENINKMKSFFRQTNTSTGSSLSFNNIFSNTNSTSQSKTTYNNNSRRKIVTKTEKCCRDTKLGDKVIIYYVYTNKNDKIALYYYPHLDKWHFRNGIGETFRGNKFYDSLEDVIAYIEKE